jgi:hypothetical protein
MKITKKIIGFSSTLLVLSPSLALAERLPENLDDVVGIFENITNWLFTGLLLISVIMLVVAGYKYMFSGGSEENTSSAKNMIIYASVGLAVAMLAKGVPTLVSSIISVN